MRFPRFLTALGLLAGAMFSLSGCGEPESRPEPPKAPPPEPLQVEGPGSLELPNLISNHLVLQAGMPVRLWGRDEPGQRVTVEMEERRADTVTGEDGNWEIIVPAMTPGGPYELLVSGSGKIVVQDVMVGQVWVASGQSNMAWSLKNTDNAQQEMERADVPELRFFKVSQTTAIEPQSEAEGHWVVSRPETVAGMSAVAYFFGRDLVRELKQPVGMITSSWGGTPVEAWMPQANLEPLAPEKIAQRDKWHLPEVRAEGKKKVAAWAEAVGAKDPGNEGEAQGWAAPDLDDSSWPTMKIPTSWERQGLRLNGVVWLRRAVEIPADWQGQPLQLGLSTWGDEATAYFNGKRLKEVATRKDGIETTTHTFEVPADLVKPGRAQLALRIFDSLLKGGLRGRFELAPKGAKKGVNLAGDWSYLVGKTTPPLSQEKLRQRPRLPRLHDLGTLLYRGMIAPLTAYTVRGFIWYQGESNSGQPEKYRALFGAMIEGWRKKWGREDLPFYFVQLANFRARQDQPSESNWARLRESQRLTEADVPSTGMATIIDIGEANDIHPRNKKDVGERLARLARARTYGETSLIDSGPLVTKAVLGQDGAVVLTLQHASGLHTTDQQAPVGFALAGEDRKFHWAKARLAGETITLDSAEVPDPRWVRYAWANNPAVNLVNGADLPAVPLEIAVEAKK